MKDAFYFPHFSNARHDRKVKRVRKELGVEGYGIFFMLLEVLREQRDFSYPVTDIDLLADEIGTSDQKVRTVISNYGLFSIVEVNGEECFTSCNLIKYLSPYLDKKEINRLYGIKGNLIKYRYLTKEQADDMTLQEILEYSENLGGESGGDLGGDREAIAIKGKEIKEIKEIKENKVNEGESYPNKLQEIIDYWNGKKLPKALSVLNQGQYALRMLNALNDWKLEYIKKAIDNLSENYDKIEPKFRPSFKTFILESCSYWHDWKEKQEDDPLEFDIEQVRKEKGDDWFKL